VIGESESYEEALRHIESAIQLHRTFGAGELEDCSPFLEFFIAETDVMI
jgi:hypothetical protein